MVSQKAAVCYFQEHACRCRCTYVITNHISRVTSHLRLNWHVIHISLTSCFCGFFLVQTFFAPKISRLPTLISCSGSIPSCGARREPSKEPIGHLPRYLFSIKIEPAVEKSLDFFGEIWKRVRSFFLGLFPETRISPQKIGSQLTEEKSTIYLGIF